VSLEHGPSSSARTPCDGCGAFCLDEEIEPSTCGVYAYCADCASAVRALEAEERRAELFDAEVQHEPRSAF
jgi:hypothetical protein